MTRAEIRGKLRTIIEPYVRESAVVDGITEETHLLTDLQIDSARLVDIILDVEEAFGIEIDDRDAEEMITVGGAVSLIERKAAPGADG